MSSSHHPYLAPSQGWGCWPNDTRTTKSEATPWDSLSVDLLLGLSLVQSYGFIIVLAVFDHYQHRDRFHPLEHQHHLESNINLIWSLQLSKTVCRSALWRFHVPVCGKNRLLLQTSPSSSNHDLIAKYSAAPFLVLAFLALADGCLQLLILQVNFRVTPSSPSTSSPFSLTPALSTSGIDHFWHSLTFSAWGKEERRSSSEPESSHIRPLHTNLCRCVVIKCSSWEICPWLPWSWCPGAITFANMGIAMLEPSLPLHMMDTMGRF